MIAVSDASPFFEKICIPEGVDREISEKDDEYKRVRELIERGFIEVLPVKNKDLVKILNSELGAGESESIVLCREIKAKYVLLDDSNARLCARSFEIDVIGTLGIIRALLKKGIIREDPKEIYKKLKSADFWISRELFSSIFEE
ncbi:MAG: DUF3368 domain-containing protein [Methanobacteriota archaeon]